MSPGARSPHDVAMDPIEAEIVVSLDELLSDEPTNEAGLCPWCGEIRAPWAGDFRRQHAEHCPWRRLSIAFPLWIAD